MNFLSHIGSYLSRPVLVKNSTNDGSSAKISFVNNSVLTNGALILGVSVVGLKMRKIPKDIFVKVSKEADNTNKFTKLIEKSNKVFEYVSHKSSSKSNKPIQVELPNMKKEIFDPTVPGAKLSDDERLSRIFVKLKDIWTKDGKVLPEKIDEILTNHVGENRVREIKFYTDEKRGILYGRKKSYRMRSGNIFVLEAHNARNGGVETRCYWAIGTDKKPMTKGNRLYLSPDGIFEPDQYFSRKAHLPSSSSAIEWVNKTSRA